MDYVPNDPEWAERGPAEKDAQGLDGFDYLYDDLAIAEVVREREAERARRGVREEEISGAEWLKRMGVDPDAPENAEMAKICGDWTVIVEHYLDE